MSTRRHVAAIFRICTLDHVRNGESDCRASTGGLLALRRASSTPVTETYRGHAKNWLNATRAAEQDLSAGKSASVNPVVRKIYKPILLTLDRLSNKGDNRVTHLDTVTQIPSLPIEQKPARCVTRRGRGAVAPYLYTYISLIILPIIEWLAHATVITLDKESHKTFRTPLLRCERSWKLLSRHARNCSPIDMKGLRRSWSITNTYPPYILYNFLILLACPEIEFQPIAVPHLGR